MENDASSYGGKRDAWLNIDESDKEESYGDVNNISCFNCGKAGYYSIECKGRMQEERDLGVKAACLAYNTPVHTSTGQTSLFATFGRESNPPVNLIYKK